MLQKITPNFCFQKINISTCLSKEILNDTCARVMYACIYIMCVFYIQSFLKKAEGEKKHEEHITYGIPCRLSWCLPFPACNFLNFTSSPQFQYTRHLNQNFKLASPPLFFHLLFPLLLIFCQLHGSSNLKMSQ